MLNPVFKGMYHFFFFNGGGGGGGLEEEKKLIATQNDREWKLKFLNL